MKILFNNNFFSSLQIIQTVMQLKILSLRSVQPVVIFFAFSTLRVVQTASINFFKCITVCTTHNASKFFFIAGCIYKYFVLRYVQSPILKKN